jgi:hypothetical protein
MSNNAITVLCTNCGLLSRRPRNFLRVRRFFICRGCKEMLPLDSRTVLDAERGDIARHETAVPRRPDGAAGARRDRNTGRRRA